MRDPKLLAILSQHVLKAAPSLLGMDLVKGELRARIVEVEAYRGSEDPGSHAHRGLTPRNQVMFGEPGHAYVYFTYGVHWCLNVVAEPEGQTSGILIRAAKPLAGQAAMFSRRKKAQKEEDLLSGPAKITEAFGITGENYGMDLLDPGSEIRLEWGEPTIHILRSIRIGLAKGKGDHLDWRFVDGDALNWISRSSSSIFSPYISDQKNKKSSRYQ